MSYTSFIYLVFLAISCLIYYMIPLKNRWIVILAANMVFYAAAGWDNLVYLLCAISISYFVALKMGKLHDEFKVIKKQGNYDRKQLKEVKAAFEKRRRKFLLIGLVTVIGALCVVKYTNFVLKNVNGLLNLVGMGRDSMTVKLIVPLGVSFFTFQIISYLVDVYKGDIAPQKNFMRYALYISFFPSVTQGPIPRYSQLGTQLETPQKFNYDNIRDGAVWIVWGFAKKLILAERLATFVNSIYDNYTSYNGIILVLATIAYSIQIYADFSSCMDIATGSARMFGIELAPNFLRPYFSKTMPEFWRRWHVSLGNWFKDYVFFPFSISQALLKLNKKARKTFGDGAGRIIASSLPILLVWALTGIWHGASWKFVVWGLFHGTLIILSTIFTPYNQNLVKKFNIRTDCFWFRLFQMLRTFTLCCIGRVFFRADGLRAALGIFKRIFSGVGLAQIMNGNIYNYGLNEKNMLVVIIAALVLLIVSILEEKSSESIVNLLSKQNLVFRWIIIYTLFFAVLVFGKYGPGYDAAGFIYEQF
ncbi:MAG: MBOAT family O-acyltransferase [Lachnospiraceae bacterium]